MQILTSAHSTSGALLIGMQVLESGVSEQTSENCSQCGNLVLLISVSHAMTQCSQTQPIHRLDGYGFLTVVIRTEYCQLWYRRPPAAKPAILQSVTW